jgi:hypothetical protein
MKTVFYPGQFLCSQVDPEAAGTKMRGVKRRLTLGTGESAGSSTSLSRRPRAATPAADPPERRRRDSPSPIRRGGEEEKRAKDPSPRSTSAASADAQLQQEVSVPSRRDKEDVSIKEKDRKDKSVEKREEESPVRRAPAKKKRAHKMSSSSDSGNSSSGCSSSDSSSSSEDMATAEVKIIDKSEEEQLSVLAKKREVGKVLKRAVKEHGPELLIKRARAFTAAQRKSQEAEKKAKMARAKQQGEEAEAESSGADQAATERIGRGKKEGSTERFVRRRTAKDELDESAPAAAGETSTVAAEEVQRVRQQGKPAPPAAGETSKAAAVKPEWLSRPDKPAPPAAGETSAAAADKSERPCGKGKLTPSVAGETGEAVVNKPEQVSRPGKPAPPAAGGTSVAAADAAEQLSKLAGYNYKILRRISPIRKCYIENFQALPTLDGCIVRAPETTQE